jgi:hypothetical protein
MLYILGPILLLSRQDMPALILLSLMLCAAVQTCHPECSWLCSSPSIQQDCLAVCEPICHSPKCAVTCTNPDHEAFCSAPSCSISCPHDQCESEECPQCETLCQAVDCGHFTDCQIDCRETMCSWQCQKPPLSQCEYPICMLSCEAPACAHVPTSGTERRLSSLLLILAAAAVLCL